MENHGEFTKQRRAVLEVVKASHDHPTAADIMDRLREKHRNSIRDIYNSLKYLVRKGLIKELHITGGVSRYDGRMEEHHHAVCDKCGRWWKFSPNCLEISWKRWLGKQVF